MFKYSGEITFNPGTSHGELAKYIKEGSRVLEFGCAKGYFSRYMHENLGCTVTGIEIDKNAIEDAMPYLEQGICCDIEAYEWSNCIENKQFDIVMFSDVLEHLRNPKKALVESLKYLKDDGRVLFSVPNIAHSDVIMKLIENRFDYSDTGILDNTHVYFLGEKNIGDFCESAGLFLENVDGVRVPVGATNQKIDNPSPVYSNVLKAKEHGDVFQFVCTALKKEYAAKINAEYKCNIKTNVFNGLKYYVDNGNGFTEENSVNVEEQSLGKCFLNVDLPKGTVRIRVDLREDSGYTVKNLRCALDGKIINPDSTHGVFKTGDTYLLLQDDSSFVFECDGCLRFELSACVTSIFADAEINDVFNSIERDVFERDENIRISDSKISLLEGKISNLNGEISHLERELQSACHEIQVSNAEIASLNEVNASLSDCFEECKRLYKAETEKSHSIEASLDEYKAMYYSIANSACWKMTKPLRALLDVTKKIIKKIPVLHKLARGLKCLKQNGFKYTLKRIKGKLHHNKEIKENQLTEQELEKQREEKFDINIKFSILVPLYNTNEKYLIEMINSVREQTYSNWELCLADGSDENHGYVEKVVREISEIDSRVKYARLEQNRGISENTNECEKMATGDYIAFLDHDDLLSKDALYENAKAINETGADVLYSDEDHLSIGGMHVNPFYKPDFSPDLLRSQMYICHFTVMRRDIFESIGGLDSNFDGSQDYDLMLRITEATDKILHIPRILYTWRECETSTAANPDAKPYAHTAGKNALDAHLKRRYGNDAYADDSDYTFVFDARYGTMKEEPLVSIIMPMKDKSELSAQCVDSIIAKSTYSNYEIIVLDNRSEEEKTFEWFEQIRKADARVKVISADMEFNWSKINNYGIEHANGEVFIFLNNDTVIITPDWIERLCENALREDIGVVGPLLLYEDETIQHAGVVVGFGGWADHVFKGMKPIHYGAPYVSPMVSRNVLAVTGACMAVSKKTIDTIGNFDERFIICGSDIELCIRAYQNGFYNKYMPTVKLYHLESKSRDSYIPQIDFKYSYECYAPYRENIDPFYNINLSLDSLIPQERVAEMNKMNFKNFLKRCPITAPICKAIKKAVMTPAEYSVPEVQPISARIDTCDNGLLRINLLTPSVDSKHVFGGIATAIKFFESLCAETECEVRIITCDAPVIEESSVVSKDYIIVKSDEDSSAKKQIVSFNDRYLKTIPVRKNDIFMATGWWTAYTINEVIKWQSEQYEKEPLPLIYMIQDYEPGFYPWSSRYMMADSTYKFKTPTYAVINSKELHTFFDNNGYSFERAWSFAPVLSDKIAEYLPKDGNPIEKKKQILVYGRPTTERNAFALLMSGLKLWREQFKESGEWQVFSAGESHDDVDLGGGVTVSSCGKLSLEEYANLMKDTYAGISLMVSPHPSYPPLEMSTFGVKTITNTYANKDMSSFNSNIVSLNSCSASDIADALTKICSEYTGKGTPAADSDYARGGKPFGNCVELLSEEIKSIVKS